MKCIHEENKNMNLTRNKHNWWT